LILWKYSSRWI